MKVKLAALLFSVAFGGVGAAYALDPEECTMVCLESRQVCLAQGGTPAYCQNYYYRCLAGCGGLQ